MIKKNNLLDYLFEISPDFREFISEELDYLKKENLYYIELGCYAYYLFEKYRNNKIDEIKKGFDKLNFLLLNGDEEVKKIIKLGFFESFQNAVLGENIELDIFNEFLSKKSKKVWDDIITFWDKKK